MQSVEVFNPNRIVKWQDLTGAHGENGEERERTHKCQSGVALRLPPHSTWWSKIAKKFTVSLPAFALGIGKEVLES